MNTIVVTARRDRRVKAADGKAGVWDEGKPTLRNTDDPAPDRAGRSRAGQAHDGTYGPPRITAECLNWQVSRDG